MVCHVQAKKMSLTAKDAGDLVGIDGEVNVKTPITVEACKCVFETLV